MGKCSELGVGLSFFSPRGWYYCSILGEKNRNVLLRREQFRFADDESEALPFARSFIIGRYTTAAGCLNELSETMRYE